MSSSFLTKSFYTVKIIVGASLSLATISLVALYLYQKNLVYPSSLNEGRTYNQTPSAYGMEYESVRLKTKDGETLDCFALKQNKSSADYTNKTVVLLGPNAGNISHYLPIVEIFYKEFNYNVFLYSYRGYGQSTGIATENGLKIDAETVLLYLAQDQQFKSSSIFLYGRSLGGANAIYMASQSSEYWNNHDKSLELNEELVSSESSDDEDILYPKLSGVILENTFLSLPKVVPYIFPILKRVANLCTEKWPSEVEILNVNADIPFLFLSGLKDEIVPPQHMKKLFELCNSEIKYFKTFKKGYHNNTCNQSKYWDYVHDFIEGEEL